MILSLFGFVVFTTGRFALSCLALCFCVLSVLFTCSIVITSLGEERAGLCVFLVHLFVYFARVNFCPLPLLVSVSGIDCS